MNFITNLKRSMYRSYSDAPAINNWYFQDRAYCFSSNTPVLTDSDVLKILLGIYPNNSCIELQNRVRNYFSVNYTSLLDDKSLVVGVFYLIEKTNTGSYKVSKFQIEVNIEALLFRDLTVGQEYHQLDALLNYIAAFTSGFFNFSLNFYKHSHPFDGNFDLSEVDFKKFSNSYNMASLFASHFKHGNIFNKRSKRLINSSMVFAYIEPQLKRDFDLIEKLTIKWVDDLSYTIITNSKTDEVLNKHFEKQSEWLNYDFKSDANFKKPLSWLNKKTLKSFSTPLNPSLHYGSYLTYGLGLNLEYWNQSTPGSFHVQELEHFIKEKSIYNDLWYRTILVPQGIEQYTDYRFLPVIEDEKEVEHHLFGGSSDDEVALIFDPFATWLYDPRYVSRLNPLEGLLV